MISGCTTITEHLFGTMIRLRPPEIPRATRDIYLSEDRTPNSRLAPSAKLAARGFEGAGFTEGPALEHLKADITDLGARPGPERPADAYPTADLS